MGTLVIRVVEYLRLAARAGRPAGLAYVIVIEEAHRLLRAGRAAGRPGRKARIGASAIGKRSVSARARRGRSLPRSAGPAGGQRRSAERPPARRAAPAGSGWPGRRTAATPAARRPRSP